MNQVFAHLLQHISCAIYGDLKWTLKLAKELTLSA